MYRGILRISLCAIFVSNLKEGVFNYSKSSYRAQKIREKEKKKQQTTLAEPQVLRQWDTILAKYLNTVTGYKLRLMALKMFLVVKFANKQGVSSKDVVTFENLEVFGY